MLAAATIISYEIAAYREHYYAELAHGITFPVTDSSFKPSSITSGSISVKQIPGV